MLLEAQQRFLILLCGGRRVWAMPEYISEHDGSACCASEARAVLLPLRISMIGFASLF
jgi:hypothetical protein